MTLQKTNKTPTSVMIKKVEVLSLPRLFNLAQSFAQNFKDKCCVPFLLVDISYFHICAYITFKGQ